MLPFYWVSFYSKFNSAKECYFNGKLIFGTDASVFEYGKNGKEFGFMVEAEIPAMKNGIVYKK